ncbi:Peptidase C80 protein, partial [Candidatus Regiella insecticola 5.15]
MPALWQPIIPDIEAEIKSANLCLSAKAVLNYRWDILNQYEQSSAELLGTSAYDFVYSQLLEKILGTTPEAQGEKVFITHPSTFQKRYTPSFSAVTMLTEEVLLSHLMGRMHYLQPFANSPQYGGQYIIQLYSDQLSVKAAQFLYNQNRDVSDWYQYDTAENKLVLHPAVATSAARVNKGKYIILLGNGSPMSERYMKKIIKLLKETILPIDISTIEQVTLLGCQLHKGDGIAVKDNLIFSIESLYDAFDKHQREINVGQIVVQDKLFFIDIMGRKWQGKLYAERNNHVAIQTAINWKEAIENDQEAVVTRSTDGLTLSYQTRSFGEDMQINNKIITMNNINPTPF